MCDWRLLTGPFVGFDWTGLCQEDSVGSEGLADVHLSPWGLPCAVPVAEGC